MEQSVSGEFSISFTTFKDLNNPGYDLLRSKTIISVDDYEFIVEQYSDTGYSKSVTAISSFFENSKKRISTSFNGVHTLNNQLSFILSNTGWTYFIEDGLGSIINTIPDFGNDNIISLLEKIISYHQIEYIILPNRSIRFAKKIGGDNDYQYRYKHNVSDVVLKEDTSNLYTVIRGTGAEGVSSVYTSPNVSVFGELEAEPIKEESFTNSSELLNYIKSKITDVPELAIESTIPELTSRETGETIWLIYEPLNVEMQTRILKQTKSLVNGELITTSVVFGNSLLKSSVDLLVAQKQNIDENKKEAEKELEESKVEYRSRFDVTDRNIVLQVERIDRSIATIDIKADNINLSVNNRITNEVALIDIRANQIDLRVSDVDNRATSSINILNNNINLKVDRGGSITDINLSPGNATINADKINLNGAVFVNGMITGSTSIEVSTDVILGRGLRFSDFTALTTGGGNLTLEAFNSISYVATSHNFNTDNVFINGKRVLTTDDL